MSTFDKVATDRINYGIILNDLPEAVINSDTELAGWILGKATPEESAACSEQLKKYGTLDFLGDPRQENVIIPSGSGHQLTPLVDQTKWRYAVVRPSDSPSLNGAQLAESLRISDADICVELWCVQKNPKSYGPDTSIGGSPAQCVQHLGRAPINESLTELNIEQVAKTVALRAELEDDNYPSIVKAIEMFRDLDVHPRTSAKMLGYFGVIESLLSHAPRPNDSADSISRQLKRNLVLLNNRMPEGKNIGFDEFGSTNPETVISKLYDYRSAIAHGGDETSKIKTLVQLHKGWAPDCGWTCISDQLWPDVFLRRMAKRILTIAMTEPQLVIDLKG